MTKKCRFVRFESRIVRFANAVWKKSITFAPDFDIHMHMMRRAHRIVFLLALLVGAAGMNYVQAAIYDGKLGTNVNYSLDSESGVLTVSGTGAMWDNPIAPQSILYISEVWIGPKRVRLSSLVTSIVIESGVTSIGKYAFAYCANCYSVVIPASVTTISNNDNYAFFGCTDLREIYVSWTGTIPAWHNMTYHYSIPQSEIFLIIPCGTRTKYEAATGWKDYTIASPAAYNLTVKTNISSYGRVKINDGAAGISITESIFCGEEATITAVTTTSDCNIDFIQWNDGNTDNPRTITVNAISLYTAQFGTIGGNCGASGDNLTWAFNRCTGVLTISGSGAMADFTASTTGYDGDGTNAPWNDYRSSITKVVLPYGLTNIGVYAFYYCDHLTDIDIPASVTSIGDKAFAGCTSLKQVCIPEGVTTIGSYLFFCMTSNTSSLQRLYLPSTLTSMGTHVVYKCGNLLDFTIPASISGWSGNMRYSRGPKENVYVSWTENIPTCPLTNEIVPSPRATLHVPYGKTSQYNTKLWYKSFTIVEDVDERAIDLGLSIRWASCNIGATAPEENGNFYAWGDTLTRSSFTWGTYPYSGTSTNTMTKYCTRAANGTVDNRSTLIAFDDAAYINWGETWRMPTWTEWNELISQCTWKDTTINNVSVWQVTGPNGNSIYLPKVGYKNSTSVTAGCYYWSSTLNTANSNDQCNRALYINAANRSSAMYGLRYVGMPVRAVYRREWPSFTLTITDTPSGAAYTKAVNAGASYTLTAQDDECHHFVRWEDGNTDNPRTVTVSGNTTYTAEFETNQYTVTVQTNTGDDSMGDVSVTINP